MASFKSRKLFPSGTNQTADCPDFCYPSCNPYDCYSFSEFYFPPPPPPPSRSSADHSQPQNQPLSLLIIVPIAVLAGFFLLLFTYYIVVVKSCAGRCSRRNIRTDPEISQSSSDGTDEDREDFLGENRIDHPIWFITTVGLQQSIINSITVCKYKKDEGLIEGSECSVCLSEFQEDEMLRLLPKCSHAFHVRCVDTWLRSHTNCPLCRAHIVRPLNLQAITNNNNGEEEDNLGAANQETQVANLEINGELLLTGESNGHGGAVDGGGGISCENRRESEEDGEMEIVAKDGNGDDESVVDANGINGENEQIQNKSEEEAAIDSSSGELETQ